MLNFNCLPWFIRKEIINSTLDYSTNYYLLSKEWLIEAAKRHGEVIVHSGRPERNFISPSYSKYFGKIRFNRLDDIDWEIIHKFKQVHSIEIQICVMDSKVECDKFINKLLELPLLKNVSIGRKFDNNFDLPRVFLSQYKIEKLNISSDCLNPCLKSNMMIFPSLVELTLGCFKSPFDMNSLLEKAPKLKKLTLDSYAHEDRLVHFGDQIIPNVRELFIDFSYDDKKVKLDLSKWPNLKKLGNIYPIEFTDFNHFTNIEDLTLTGGNDYISSVIGAKFPKLRKLNLEFYDVPDKELMIKILKLCTIITRLKLVFPSRFELPKNLPIEPYTVTELDLGGYLYIDSVLLLWLSTNFNLVKLNLDECILTKETPLATVPFTTLTLLTIFTQDYDQFENHFNQTHYPHINFIIIRRACYSCRYINESFSTNLDETKIILNPMDIFENSYL